MIKGSTQQKGKTFVNICAPNIGAPKYIKQILTDLKGKIDSNTVIIGDLITQFTSMDRSSRQKINKETLALNDTLHHMDLTVIYETFHPKATEYTFFSSIHGRFSMIDHMLGQKVSLNKFKKIEIISNIFSDYNGIKLEINYRKKTGKFTNIWRLNNMLLNNQWVYEEIKKEIRKYLKANENGNTTLQNLWDEIQAYLKK